MHMRIVRWMMLIGAACFAVWAGDAVGIWKVNPLRSRDPYPGIVTVRFEPHAKGEVLTLDQVHEDGRMTTTSNILYFDGKERDSTGSVCSGTQSSRRVDSRTVEILTRCADGMRVRVIRRVSGEPNELIAEITEKSPDGHLLERRLVLERQ